LISCIADSLVINTFIFIHNEAAMLDKDYIAEISVLEKKEAKVAKLEGK
jgi:hypothetical protein